MGGISDLRIATGYWYLATPYSKWPGGIEDASFIASELAGLLLLEGVNVFSPIAHSHAISQAAKIDPHRHDIWLPADKPLFEGAHGILVASFPGWRTSKGITMEIEWAHEHKKPRFLVNPQTLDWVALP